MGLCKCPKRRVTNQFCFEHRVNVCNYCMVTNHPKCIVQSYLQWLQDSDYNPICEICTKKLEEDECIRLTCYHVFHWPCAERLYRSLPRTTAPAGYQCPTCASPIFPPPNLASPVANVLREKLAGVNWARAGLGLPLLSEDQDLKVGMESRRSLSPADGHSSFSIPDRVSPLGASDDEAPHLPNGISHSIVQMGDDTTNMYDSKSVKRIEGNQAPRRIFQDADSTKSSSNFDHDDNKYKGKPPYEHLVRMWKNLTPQVRTRRSGPHLYKRYALLAIVVIVGVVALLYVITSRVRSTDDDDPFADLSHQPHLRVVQKN